MSMFEVPLGFAEPAEPDSAEGPGVLPGPDAPAEPLVVLLPPQRTDREVPDAVRADVAALMQAGNLPIGRQPWHDDASGAANAAVGSDDRVVDVVLTAPSGARALVPHDGFAVVGRLPGSALLIDNPGISRRHCQVGQRAGVAILEDLFSGNGTWVNRRGVRMDVPRGATVELSSNDWVFSLDVPLFRVMVSETRP